MNRIELLGRMTKDPVVKKTTAGKDYCAFSLAVDRRYKNQDGTRPVDYINCVIWGKAANTIATYFKKGSRILVLGSLQSRKYDDNGTTKYINEVIVDEFDFIEKQLKPEPQIEKAIETEPQDPFLDLAPDLDDAEYDDLPIDY